MSYASLVASLWLEPTSPWQAHCLSVLYKILSSFTGHFYSFPLLPAISIAKNSISLPTTAVTIPGYVLLSYLISTQSLSLNFSSALSADGEEAGVVKNGVWTLLIRRSWFETALMTWILLILAQHLLHSTHHLFLTCLCLQSVWLLCSALTWTVTTAAKSADWITSQLLFPCECTCD